MKGGGKNHVRVALIIIVIIGFFLIRTGATTADLSDEETVRNNRFTAGTLALSTQSTATNEKKSTLFFINGLVSDGFDVQSLRVVHKGTQKSAYRVTVQSTGGDVELCNALTITIATKNFEKKYEGKLLDLHFEQPQSTEGKFDWIYVLSPQNENIPKGKSCTFAFVIETVGTALNGRGFTDKKIVQNSVYTAP